MFNPSLGKLDERTISYYFIGYPERSKGFRFYIPDRHTKFAKTRHDVFLENDMIRGSGASREIDLEEKRVYAPTPIIEEPYFSLPTEITPPEQRTHNAFPDVDVESSGTAQNEKIRETLAPTVPTPEILVPTDPEPQDEEQETVPGGSSPQHHQEQQEIENDIPIRRSQRVRKPAISSDYEVYIVQDMNSEEDPVTFEEAMKSPHSSKWRAAMEDEMKSMRTNKVWDLEIIPEGAKKVGSKWVYKTMRDSKGKIERYKARLVAKGFTQREGIDYNETFSPVSTKDLFRIIIALVAHFDLELHQMDVKTTFLNGELSENIYMAQQKGFVIEGKKI